VATVVGGLVLGRREVVQALVEALFVEPGDPAAGGDLEVAEVLPGAAVDGQAGEVADQLGLVEPIDRLGQRIIVGLSG